MSFDIFLQCFARREAVGFDAGRVLELLVPVIVEQDGGFVRIATSEGKADIYGLDTTKGLMVNHASGVDVWDLIVDIARAARLTIMPVGCATCVVDEAALEDLPDGIPVPIAVVRTGADLLRVVEGSPQGDSRTPL